MEEETIWLSRVNIAQLYGTSPQNITMHIKNIYEEGELEEDSTSKNYLLVQDEGGREVAIFLQQFKINCYMQLQDKLQQKP